jgi:hypothetical protein
LECLNTIIEGCIYIARTSYLTLVVTVVVDSATVSVTFPTVVVTVTALALPPKAPGGVTGTMDNPPPLVDMLAALGSGSEMVRVEIGVTVEAVMMLGSWRVGEDVVLGDCVAGAAGDVVVAWL